MRGESSEGHTIRDLLCNAAGGAAAGVEAVL